ncbi:hypothetical protein TNCT_636761 [Trichonephila clavata]|uniref:Uncharacterized protein n=1 Tax=Trichonephila clavata TaxID=2740835 RepID=A0A8X6LT33_TRICU|nr:hypothetical protein TNCT_636761 [Trichonephila clavata]
MIARAILFCRGIFSNAILSPTLSPEVTRARIPIQESFDTSSISSPSSSIVTDPRRMVQKSRLVGCLFKRTHVDNELSIVAQKTENNKPCNLGSLWLCFSFETLIRVAKFPLFLDSTVLSIKLVLGNQWVSVNYYSVLLSSWHCC